MLNSLIGSKNIENDFENLISKYPEVELDYTLITNKDMKFADIDKILSKFTTPIIKSRKLLNIYENEREKKVSIRYIVGSHEKTLDGTELQNFKDEFIKHIKANGLNIIE